MADSPAQLPPPRPLLTRNPLRWLQFFGPGAVIASLTIGSGELLFPSRLGAMFGYRMLWLFPAVALLKWVMAYCSARHIVLSGAHPFERWNQIPGPRGWLTLFLFSIYIIYSPFAAFFMQGLLGSISASIFPGGDLYTWATIWVVASLILLAIGKYAFLERAQMLILGSMLACTFVAVVFVQPDWSKAIQGAVVPQLPDYPEWVTDKYESFRDRTIWVELALAAAFIGGVATDYFCYVSFLREKHWGRSGMATASDEELSQIASDEDCSVRAWVKAALIDTTLSMTMVVLISSCFLILGAVILQQQQLVPEKDEELLLYQGQFLSSVSPLLLPLYQVGVVLAFFGNVYGGPAMVSQILFEFARSRNWEIRAKKKVHWFALLWPLLGGLAILWIKRWFPDMRMVDIITFPAMYTGMIMCGVFCLTNPWIDYRFLPSKLRMNRRLVALNLCAGMIFFLIGLKAMWDQSAWHFVILPSWVAGSMLVAAYARRLPDNNVT